MNAGRSLVIRLLLSLAQHLSLTLTLTDSLALSHWLVGSLL